MNMQILDGRLFEGNVLVPPLNSQEIRGNFTPFGLPFHHHLQQTLHHPSSSPSHQVSLFEVITFYISFVEKVSLFLISFFLFFIYKNYNLIKKKYIKIINDALKDWSDGGFCEVSASESIKF